MTTTNLRALLDWNGGYEHVCREERNLAAIVYGALLEPENVRRLFAHVGCRHEVVDGELAVFYEYAYLRDLWFARVRKDPELARRVILELLGPPNREELAAMSIWDFNAYFVGARASAEWIQSPSNWSIGRFAENIADDAFFLRVCRFKWAFNAKPDIVIHTRRDRAVCIEAKYESGEGKYPSAESEKAEFRRRGLERVGQTELQAYALGELLGIETEFLFLVDKPSASSATHATVTWREVFDVLEIDRERPVVREWLGRLR